MPAGFMEGVGNVLFGSWLLVCGRMMWSPPTLVKQVAVTLPIAHQLRTIPKRTLTEMVDPKRVIGYEDMLKVIHQPEKVIIDVRNPEEVNSTGLIPSSINIPLNSVHHVLTSLSDDEFQKQYQRTKPSESDELIFYCQSGRRSTEALNKALELGYSSLKHIWAVGMIGPVNN